MANRATEISLPLQFNGGLNFDKSPHLLGDGEYQVIDNLLYRDGEFVVRKDHGYVDNLSNSSLTPNKIFAYTTDRDKDGALSTTRWIVVNTTDGKLYRGVEGDGSWEEIKLHGTDSFNISVEEFHVIGQDLVFHTGHTISEYDNAYIYGYREINRDKQFGSTIGWYCDNFAPLWNPGVVWPEQYSSAEIEEGTTSYAYIVAGSHLYKYVFSGSQLLSLVWSANVVGKSKIVGIDSTNNKIYVANGLNVVEPGFHWIYAYDTSTGLLKEEIELQQNGTPIDVNDATFYTSGGSGYFACVGNGDMIYVFDSGGRYQSETDANYGTGWNLWQCDVVDNNGPVIFVGGQDGSGNVTYRGYEEAAAGRFSGTSQFSTSYAAGASNLQPGGLTAVTVSFDFAFASVYDDANNSVRYYTVDVPTYTVANVANASLSTPSTIVNLGKWYGNGQYLRPNNASPVSDLVWVDYQNTVQTEWFKQVSIDASAVGTGTVNGSFRYKAVLVFDKTQRTLPSKVYASVTATDASRVEVTVYLNPSVDLRRADHIEIYRSTMTGGRYGQYYLLDSIDLKEDGRDNSGDGKPWTTDGTMVKLVLYDTDQNLIDTYFALSDIQEDTETIGTKFKVAQYVNGHFFYGNLKHSGENYNDRIGFSPLDAPGVNPSTNYITLSKGDPDEITAMVYFDDVLLVGKKNSLYMWDVSSYVANDWYESFSKSGVGIHSKELATATPFGIVFADANGIYLLSKQNGIRNLIKGRLENDFKAKNLDNCILEYVPAEQAIWFFVEGDTKVWVYDLVYNGWVMDDLNGELIYDVLNNRENQKSYALINQTPTYDWLVRTIYTEESSTLNTKLMTKDYGRSDAIQRIREVWVDSDFSSISLEVTDGVGTVSSSNTWLPVGHNTEFFNVTISGNGVDVGSKISSLVVKVIPTRLRKRN